MITLPLWIFIPLCALSFAASVCLLYVIIGFWYIVRNGT